MSARAGLKNFIPEEDIWPLAAAFLKGEPIEGELAVISREQAEEADYNLSPSRWVMASSGEDPSDLKSLLTRFKSILDEEATVSANLQVALKKLQELV